METSRILATERPRTSRLAIAALVMSILGNPIVTCPVGLLGMQGIDSVVSPEVSSQHPGASFLAYLTGGSALLAPVALLTSIVSLARVYWRASRLKGRSLAWAALSLSLVSTLIWLALAVVMLQLMSIG